MRKYRMWGTAVCMAMVLLLGCGLMPVFTAAADTNAIVGQWAGTLNPGAQPKTRILVHISMAQDGTLSGTIDYPDQNTSGISITAISYKEPTLHFESSSSMCVFEGTMSSDSSQIAGTWKQGGAPLSLVLKRVP